MLFQSFAGSHRSGVSACNRAPCQPSPRKKADCCYPAARYQTAWVELREATSGLSCSSICFVFCGERMVRTKPARNTGMVQLCPSSSYSLTPQCLMKQLLPSPLPSALLIDNNSLGGSTSLFSFSHPDPTLIKTKMGAGIPTHWQGNSAVLLFVLGQMAPKMVTLPIITTESLYSKNLTNW